jgi:hypothetical protein
LPKISRRRIALWSLIAIFLVWDISIYAHRQTLFSELRPIKLANCTLKRFGADNDGGYLMCDNLLDTIQSAYSYGIDGKDEWGCAVSENYHVPVHQYDCFNAIRPVCAGAKFVFHDECIGGRSAIIENKRFDTFANQIPKNNGRNKIIVVKMDVEGAEWDSLLATPEELFSHIEQLVVEFHGIGDKKYISVLQKLKKVFYIAHVHFNNYSCSKFAWPLPSRAYEVLFVNKRIGIVDETDAKPLFPNPLDAPNAPHLKDCQAVW